MSTTDTERMIDVLTAALGNQDRGITNTLIAIERELREEAESAQSGADHHHDEYWDGYYNGRADALEEAAGLVAIKWVGDE